MTGRPSCESELFNKIDAVVDACSAGLVECEAGLFLWCGKVRFLRGRRLCHRDQFLSGYCNRVRKGE